MATADPEHSENRARAARGSEACAALPTLWLLGKTGAGKTSIVKRITGDEHAAVGNGYEPCTRTARHYDYPADRPVMRFLDTRGLGEAHYDPAVDLAACGTSSHALLVVARVDDPEHADLTEALHAIRSALQRVPVLIVHTALHTVEEPAERSRALRHNTAQLTAALGREVPEVAIDLTFDADGKPVNDGLDTLCEAMVALVPALHDLMREREQASRERAAFATHRATVLSYAKSASAIDLLPVVGALAVPALQGKMLYDIAGRYRLSWNRQLSRDFVTALGAGAVYRYGVGFGLRQLAKLLPAYGQTAGAAMAAGLSFASTYAFGRAACYYAFHRGEESAPDVRVMQQLFREAFSEVRKS